MPQAVLLVHQGVVGAFEEVVHRYAEIVRQRDELGNPRLPFAGFIAADGVLVGAQIHGQF